MSKVNILGTDYTIEVLKASEDPYLKKREADGYCDELTKQIVIVDTGDKEIFPDATPESARAYYECLLRHEIIHAFLNESGLSDCVGTPSGGWAKNEEMIDWIAIQSPKIFKVYQGLGILG